MAFENFSYDIISRMPEWYKEDKLAMSVNEYTQGLIVTMLQALLTNIGVVQPLNCWKTIPEEYTWYHHYKATDDYLIDEQVNRNLTEDAVTTLFESNKIYAMLPNTKRNCHAKIQLKLLGTEVIRTEEGTVDTRNNNLISGKEIIEKIEIENAGQKLTLKNIPSISTIEILTESNEIFVDGVRRPDLVEGRIHKIKPVIKNLFYYKEYIDEKGDFTQINEHEYKDTKGNIYRKHSTKDVYYKKLEEGGFEEIDLEDENKETKISLNSSKTVNFDLQVYLYKPTYTTQQNIRISTVSAFPLEWVRLYGYFCHPFNNKSGYKFLWEKKYSEESRTVYDRITKQYDCERFFIQVKFQGIGVPLSKGFPQEQMATNPAFQPNPNLDKWGKIYGLERRAYKKDITEDEEPYTFPEYYTYPIEQDYWYEERMVNEYQFNDEAVNALFIRDNALNNIGELECIYPFTHDIWLYTETVNPKSPIEYTIGNIPLHCIQQDENTVGMSWENPQLLLSKKPIHIQLNPSNDDTLKLNNNSNKTKSLKCRFDLTPYYDEVPKNIKIKGIELKFKTNNYIQSNTIQMSVDSTISIPYSIPNFDGTYSFKINKIPIFGQEGIWLKEKGYYTIGGKDTTFTEGTLTRNITREELFEGNSGKVEFDLVFINKNNFLQSDLYIEDMFLNIYYEIISPNYEIKVRFDKEEILKTEKLNMNIDVKNLGDIEIKNKEIIIIIPPELSLDNQYNTFKFSLDLKEEFTIPNIKISPRTFPDGIRTGWYDILVICEDKVISKEILIRGGQL